MGRKRHFRPSERLILFGYFLSLIFIGTFLLSLPVSWSGRDGQSYARMIDAFFTAVSAACVTGLTTVDTTLWSFFGQCVLMGLIQAGGLGIVTFGMLYLVFPGARISLRRERTLQESFEAGRVSRARQVMGRILTITFTVEAVGAVLLYIVFRRSGSPHPVFYGIFHAVSAFCNAGFSLFSDGMAHFRDDALMNYVLMGLIILGGLGFMVISDIRRKIHNRRRPLLFHTRLMLLAVPFFILVGWAGYFFLEDTGAFSSLPLPQRLTATLFQSVTTRTAGFNTVDQAALSAPSRRLTLALMLIGGGSGSMAGGLKVSTAFILGAALLRGLNENGDVRFLRRRISSDDVVRAAMFFLKAMALLFAGILSLGILENPSVTGFSQSEIVFECVSALGTVGLSMGITAQLSFWGKIVVAATMFAGRVGLFSLVMRLVRDRTERLIEYPKGEILIG